MKRLACALALAAAASPAQATDRAAAREALGSSATYFFDGNLRAARIEALNAVKADPGWGLARAMLARTQLALGDGASADAALTRAVKAGMAQARLNHLRAHAALMTGKPQLALKLAASPVSSRPSQAYAARVAAAALIALKRPEDAARTFDAALAANPDSSQLWTDIARFRLSRGDLGGAGEAARRAVGFNENNGEALILTGQLVRGQYGPVASLEWFDRALALDQGNMAALGESAATLGDTGQYGLMLQQTRRMLSIEPENARALYLQAVMAARARDYDLSRALVYRMGERMADVPAVHLLKGVLALEGGNAEQAMIQLEPLAWFQRTNLTVWRLYGLALLRGAETDRAFHRLAPLGDRADADSYTLLTLAHMQEVAGNWRGAGVLRDRAALSSRVVAPPFDLYGAFRPDQAAQADERNADVAVPRLAALVATGQAATALPLARAIAAQNRGSAAAQVVLGDVLEALQDFSGAAQAYRAAANIEFNEANALRLVSALERSGQTGASLIVLDTFLAQNPRNLTALTLAANQLIQREQWDAAIATMNRLRARIGNRDATLLIGLAWAHYRNGDTARGLLYADAAYALAPANPVVAGTNGWIRFESGRDPQGGRALLKKAASIVPDNAQLRDWLSQTRS